jgi:casein kinase 1
MCGILHGDIKPDNFLFGTKNKSSKIYMIDYGMSKKYQHENG